MDVIRWAQACRSMADEWNVRVHLGQALNWNSVAPIATVHLPPNLSALLFMLYMERDQTEAAYAELQAGVKDARRAYSARYGLRRWSAMARSILNEWDRYSDRSWFTKVRSRSRWRDRLDEWGAESETMMRAVMLTKTKDSLSREYGYKLGDDGELLEENHSAAAYDAMKAEWLAAVKDDI